MRARVITVLLSLAACTEGGKPPPEASPQIEAEPAPITQSLDELISDALLLAARDYYMWGRVDELMRVAPAPCADPSAPVLQTGVPSHVRRSQANDSAHAEKLYYLFAGLDGRSASSHYLALGGAASQSSIPVGFTIVKQSWKAVSEPSFDTPKPEKSVLAPDPVMFVLHRDQALYVGEQAELFIMIKLGERDLEGTDAGWIYGTVTADGKTVTSKGKVQPCMDCHDAAPHERLFGLQTTKALVDIPTQIGDMPVSTERLGLE